MSAQRHFRATCACLLVGLLQGVRPNYPMTAAGRIRAADTAGSSGQIDRDVEASLLGIWGVELEFGPRVRGPVTLTRVGDRWSLSVAGAQGEAPLKTDSVTLSLPGSLGELRARLRNGGRTIDGFWIQPATTVSGVRYASPVHLERRGRAIWRGDIDPLADRYSLYLRISAANDRTLSATFSNPQANHRGGASHFRVEQRGDTLRFIDSTGRAPTLTAQLDSAPRRIVLPWPQLGYTLVLTPMSRNDAVGYVPRVSPVARYEYRTPLSNGDGWRTARASSVGVDEALLAALVDRIVNADPDDPKQPSVHSLLIARRGTLVLEEYFRGFDADRTHDLRSASKTFTGVMLGAAMLHGASIAPETKVYPLFGGVAAFGNADPRKDSLTIAHLLTHSSGLACDDNDDASPGEENHVQGQTEQPDWFSYTLALPMVHAPGEHYAYCSMGMNLVGGALVRRTHLWLPELFHRWVARPLGITRYHWNLTSTGDGYGGGGVHMLPRDVLKIGAAYLNAGSWNGARIATPAWVRRATARQIDVPALKNSDGFAWHRNTFRVGERSYDEYEANGNGGQLLILVPSLSLAIVFTAGDYGNYRAWRTLRESIVPTNIIPAVRDR